MRSTEIYIVLLYNYIAARVCCKRPLLFAQFCKMQLNTVAYKLAEVYIYHSLKVLITARLKILKSHISDCYGFFSHRLVILLF